MTFDEIEELKRHKHSWHSNRRERSPKRTIESRNFLNPSDQILSLWSICYITSDNPLFIFCNNGFVTHSSRSSARSFRVSDFNISQHLKHLIETYYLQVWSKISNFANFPTICLRVSSRASAGTFGRIKWIEALSFISFWYFIFSHRSRALLGEDHGI